MRLKKSVNPFQRGAIYSLALVNRDSQKLITAAQVRVYQTSLSRVLHSVQSRSVVVVQEVLILKSDGVCLRQN